MNSPSYFKENYPEKIFLDKIEIPCVTNMYIRSRTSSFVGDSEVREISIQGRMDAISKQDLDSQIQKILKIRREQTIPILSQEANRQEIHHVILKGYPQFYPIPYYEHSRFLRIHLIEYKKPILRRDISSIEDWKKIVEIDFEDDMASLMICKIYYLDLSLLPLIVFLNPIPSKRKRLPISPAYFQNHIYQSGDTYASLSLKYYFIPDFDYLIRKHNRNFDWISNNHIYIPPLIKMDAPIFSFIEKQEVLF